MAPGTPAGSAGPEPEDWNDGVPAPAWAVAPGTGPATIDSADTANGSAATGTTATPGGTAASWQSLDPRSGPQLLLDAIIAAITGTMAGTNLGASGGLPVRIGVLIGYRSLLGHCQDAGITDHGRPVSAANIRRLACDGGLLPAVLGTAGEMLDMGREARLFTPAQRKALAIRDRGCAYPGCHRTAATTEAHHVTPWSEGGETNVDSGCLLCQHHHLMVHAGLITLQMLNGIPYLTARKGQPRGDPERNLHWHPELRTAGYTPPLFTD